MESIEIQERAGILQRLLNTIERWERIASDEFSSYGQQFRERYPNGIPDAYDPTSDEALTLQSTSWALYGSLAVAIAAYVEYVLASLFRSRDITITPKKTKGQGSAKPAESTGEALEDDTRSNKLYFEDYIREVESKCKCKRRGLCHYKDHLFVRELANRFKHSGGKSTAEFIKKFGSVARVSEVDQDIPFDSYCWKCYITQAKEFLKDVAKRLSAKEAA